MFSRIGPCRFDGCGRPRYRSGWCTGHYAQVRGGQELQPLRPRRRRGRCTFEGCDRPHRAKGLCSSHLDQLARGKDLTPIRVWKTTCEFPSCDRKHVGNGLCRGHSTQVQRGKRLTPLRPRRGFFTKQGYVLVKAPPGHANAHSNGYIFEHVLVMSERLGRPLLPHESVHHKNGVRDDNRPQNLELWTRHQPTGARVEDLVAWATEILALYGTEATG